MRLVLKDFQSGAVDRVVRRLRIAASDAPRSGDAHAVVLSAPTGSGKTVVATAAIERLFSGDEEVAPDPTALVLWITDNPSLNEQTRRKFEAASTLLDPSRLVVIDNTFDAEVLDAGVGYFLNTQKLAVTSRLIRPGDDRTFTFWETFANTIAREDRRLYLVIDEAHRGMTEDATARAEATSIIQKFIKGSDEIRPAPVILGVSATPERFNRLLTGATRILAPVTITPADVRESGLLKDRVSIFHPAPGEHGPSDLTLLREAAKDLVNTTDAWRAYTEAEGEKPVRPILVVQVENRTPTAVTATDLAEAVAAVRAEIPWDLPEDAFAHAFDEGELVLAADTPIRYLRPEDIDQDPDLVVVFFKTALNTGWDCPRAEVMMSFRTAADATNIAQLVGRMVRTPLARRIDSDERLNGVALYLPHYDRAQLTAVVARLTDEGELGDIEIDDEPRVDLPKATGSTDAFAALEALPSFTIPRARRTSEVRRLLTLARALAGDELDEDADERETRELTDVLVDAHNARAGTEDYQAVIDERSSLSVSRSDWIGGADLEEGAVTEIPVSAENIEDLFAYAGRKFGEGLHKAYWKRRARDEGGTAPRARIEAAALAADREVLATLQARARERVRALLTLYETAIAGLPEGRRATYDEIRRAAAAPERMTLAYPDVITVKAVDSRYARHVYAKDEEDASLALGGWEAATIAAELEDEAVLFWLRNPDRKPYSLTVPYKAADGEIHPLFPDLVVVRRTGDSLRCDLLDPHNSELMDAARKAHGLADYARDHGMAFGRVELIAKIGDELVRLDLKDEDVRARIYAATSAEALTQVFRDAAA